VSVSRPRFGDSSTKSVEIISKVFAGVEEHARIILYADTVPIVRDLKDAFGLRSI
jgi:hypothetical protein